MTLMSVERTFCQMKCLLALQFLVLKKRVLPTAMAHVAWLSQVGLVSVSVSDMLLQKLCPIKGVDNSLLSKTAFCNTNSQFVLPLLVVGIGSLLVVTFQH